MSCLLIKGNNLLHLYQQSYDISMYTNFMKPNWFSNWFHDYSAQLRPSCIVVSSFGRSIGEFPHNNGDLFAITNFSCNDWVVVLSGYMWENGWSLHITWTYPFFRKRFAESIHSITAWDISSLPGKAEPTAINVEVPRYQPQSYVWNVVATWSLISDGLRNMAITPSRWDMNVIHLISVLAFLNKCGGKLGCVWGIHSFNCWKLGHDPLIYPK